MCADNVQRAMDVDRDAAYWYDQDIDTEKQCPKCKQGNIISSPDCTTYCSNNICNFEER